MQIKKYETEYGGKKLKVEISDLANQANGSVLVRYGETAVFATAVISGRKREDIDFFPLVVDYEERLYAAGKISGSRFIKREGRPSEEAVLTGRIIDRTIRPLFDNKIRNEVQVVVTTLSVDGENDTDVPAIIGASLALGISDIPWDGPIGAARVGRIDGKFVINPTYTERENSDLDSVVCGKDGYINMVEAGAKEVPEEVVAESFDAAMKEIAVIEDFQKKIISEIGKEKIKIETKDAPQEMKDFFANNFKAKLEEAIYSQDNIGKKSNTGSLKDEWIILAKDKFPETQPSLAANVFEESVDKLVHDKAIDEGKRPDGRAIDELRKVYAGVNYLPAIHGSSVFYRGETHILSTITLGGPGDAQLIDGMEVETTKHFMHHYNFPPFSVGETGRMGSPGRREIGHGALVERALLAVIPSKEDFPYTIRIVSESMASNGSTSQGSVCASTLALMDAGVPIKNPIAGVSVGLMMRNDNEYKIITDIQGFEDHFGDMDFKCAGSKEGLTAIQLDIKLGGIPVKVLKEALGQAKEARDKIMEVMLAAIPEPRKELSPTAPRIITMKINPDKIREVIGPGGKMINSIIEKTGANIDIEQDGSIFITGKNLSEADAAKNIIEDLTHDYQPGEIVEGPVTRLFDFGAMMEVGYGQEGLVHISELAPFRVNKVTDVVKEGDIVKAKVIIIDEKGRINLSIKQLDPNYKPEDEQRNSPNGFGRGNNHRNNGGERSNHKRFGGGR
ncbi:TPA: polyribonucleotide nucleotidyltransferase [Patescibacteria group bacterium]|nr:MAG: Polyribonucleotide nucleotidyltransferase [Parcubacteria group bacterium GW2011_GWF2_40_10]KKR47901.1 MAG: Polyribonucleotide nucleotidyltransferase [Parcubacteria group bacterium GW2011_GWA2_40_143]KKR60349.1 MAG: Polyribonucleotide nucleotidyltransferase [Parcubacteria group bacterium GW2011_GWC2_40_31]KKR75153.1 MAG: Polyribonucleotide nucleotidyltransferase [Parcubacteria group bacterium GW2011_GWB2_40_8]KKR82625.1 MAG: Polyribonucleotide nucleotidyltransferase [Parcubacteria group 